MKKSMKLMLLPAAMMLCGGVRAQDAARRVTTIPAGTEIAVRTIDPIDSEGADLNHEYAASLADPLVVNDVNIAPRGANAMLRVVEAKKAGKFKGRASLSLALVAVTIHDKTVPVETGATVSESGSQGSKTAKRGVIGGAAGAVIGGIVGGGKGAAIGAASGAAVGAGSAALSGQHVKVPAETRLTFTLAQPASLN